MLRTRMATDRGKRIIGKALGFRHSRKMRKISVMDTTEYLMSNPLNWKRLCEAIEDVESGRNIVHRDLIEV